MSRARRQRSRSTDDPPALNISGGAITLGTLAVEGGTVEIVEAVPPLTLDDWTTPTGETAEVLMLVTHGSGDAYQAGSSGSISAGSDAALDNADITINRIRIISSGALIRLNHSGAGAWNAEFGPGLDYEDAIAYVQIGDTPIALTLGPRNVANIRFNVPAASQAALNALGQGDIFILAITVPETVEVTNLNVSGGDLDLGEIAATGGTVTIVPPTPLNISGGAVTFGALAVEGGAVEVAQPATPLNVSGGAITFGALTVEGGTVRVFIPPPTISQTIILGGFSGGGWSGAVLLNSGLIEGGAVAYLRRVYTSGSSPRVEIASSATASPADLGPEFTDGVETWGEAFLFDADGSTVTLKGPNHPDNSFSDPSEPYFWTPDNSAAWRAWFLAAPAATLVTVTISGPSLSVPLNISGGELDFGALTVTGGTVEVIAPTPLNVSGGGVTFGSLAVEGGTVKVSALPPPTPLNITGGAVTFGDLGVAGGTVEVFVPVAALTLADWTTPDDEVLEVLMLVTHGAGDAYNAGSSGSIASGSDAALDQADITINRIRIGGRVRLDRTGADAFSSYFVAGQAYENAVVYIQTADRTVALELNNAGVANARWNVPAGDLAHLQALAEDDLFLLAITVPETADVTNLNVSGGSLDFGDLAVGGGVARVVAPTPLVVTGGEIALGTLAVEGGTVEIAPPPTATPLNISGGSIALGTLVVTGGTVKVVPPTPLNVAGGGVTLGAIAVEGGTVTVSALPPTTPLNIAGGAITFGALDVQGGAVEVASPVPLSISGGMVTFGSVAVAGGTVEITQPTSLAITGGAISFEEMTVEGGTVEIVQPITTLTLDDWTTPAGETVDILMLVTHGSGDTYQAGTSGSISADSDAELDDADITINRIRIRTSDARFRINRSGSGSFSANFVAAGGAYVEAAAYIQTADRVIPLTQGSAIAPRIDFNVPTADQAHILALGDGDLFIFAITVPVAVAVTNLNVSGGGLTFGTLDLLGGTVGIVPEEVVVANLSITGGLLTFGTLDLMGGSALIFPAAMGIRVGATSPTRIGFRDRYRSAVYVGSERVWP